METSTKATRRWVKDLGELGADSLRFARALGGHRESSDGLLVLGTAEYEPWHFVAHFAEEATRTGRVDLHPTWIRWNVPPGAPPHLAVSVDRLSEATRHQTLLVVSSCADSPELLERVSDVKKRGARIMSVHRGDDELSDLSHEMVAVSLRRPDQDFDLTQHIVSDVAPTAQDRARPWWPLRRAKR
jgi:hypothetical protein